MVDITMCSSHDCPLAAHCHRSPQSGTESSEWRQSWSAFKWAIGGDHGAHCAHYWPAHQTVTTNQTPHEQPRRA